ncbi:hypothetical protein SAMN04488552_0191 [Christiangramia echinicola]|uniref:Lipoprotein n=2 Tax=Christiangramia echinicola TaxID=279359 RepID=A0A1H1KU11_9FLAO|nr:hypothetical protein SAMN04488552_0191 [Christiangramia echinicola]
MKNYSLLLIIIILSSCNFKEKKTEISFPLKDIQVKSIQLEKSNEKVSDTLILNKFSNLLQDLSHVDLVKGKRLHGATKLCDLTLKTNKNDILLFVSRSQKKELVVSFFEFNEKDNFNYFLGALYKTEHLSDLIETAGLECKN